MKNMVFGVLIIVSALTCRAENQDYDPQKNDYKIITYTDTVFDHKLPPIEFIHYTYNNMDDVTTAGFKVILRGGEVEITGATLYKASSEFNVNKPYETFYPLRIHLGDSTSVNTIQHAYIYPRFPFTTRFYEEDSLVIHTNNGDKTIYLTENYRKRLVAKKNITELENSNRSLKFRNYALISLILIILAVGLYYLIHQHRISVRQKKERERLLAIISENEMNNRELKEAVTSQFRKNFEIINKLCYEYFELADSPALKKCIYSQVESEINKLRDPSRLKELEDSLNEYCDNIMVRISEQLPELTEKEHTLLLYLYSGLSARTICILTEIQVKNFYMRRQRLKTKILTSTAPDRINFAEMM